MDGVGEEEEGNWGEHSECRSQRQSSGCLEEEEEEGEETRKQTPSQVVSD